MPRRHIRTIWAAVALAIPLGAAVCGVAVPAAQAQTITIPQARAASHPPVVGMDLYVNENYSLADTTAWGERDLKYIADTLKLKAVAIVWDYNVRSRTSSVVSASPTRTPTIADLAELTRIAHHDGLRVEYRAMFAVHNKDTRSTSIQPKHLRAWLQSLLFAELPALDLAQRDHVSEFVVGTEMASIDQSPLWGGFFTDAATVFKGILSYAIWGGRGGPGSGFFDKHPVLQPTAYLGVTAYPPIMLPARASVAALTSAWESFLTTYTTDSVLRRTAIDEMGIPAVLGAYYDPWQWDALKGPAAPVIQARWYTAACRAVTAEHMRGLYFWSMPLNDDPANPFPSLVGWEGRPASIAAITSCS